MRDNKNLLEITFGILIIWFIEPISYFDAIRTHLYNNEVYLRKMSLEIDKFVKSNKQYDENWKYTYIQEQYCEAELIIDSLLEQMRCIESGKMRLGLISKLIPNMLLNDEEKTFDLYNETILNYYAKEKNLLKEDLELKRTELLKRSMGKESKNYAIAKIAAFLPAIIEKHIADYIIEQNNFEIPSNLPISRYFKYNRDKDKIKTIIQHLIKFELTINSEEVADLIKKIFLDPTLDVNQ